MCGKWRSIIIRKKSFFKGHIWLCKAAHVYLFKIAETVAIDSNHENYARIDVY